MMDTLDLAWETYEFYTNEIMKCEETHSNTLKTLKKFVNENPYPKQYQKKRVKNKCIESCSKLTLLYNKQIQALDDLIDIYNHRVDIPEDKEVDLSHLLTLKNITAVLIQEINKYKEDINNSLN